MTNKRIENEKHDIFTTILIAFLANESVNKVFIVEQFDKFRINSVAHQLEKLSTRPE